MYELAAATVEYGRQVGARVLEGYPTEPTPGKTVIWDDASVGLLQVFIDAGYEVEASPTLRRRVVRHRLGARPDARSVQTDISSKRPAQARVGRETIHEEGDASSAKRPRPGD
jgi:hypothetical protein